MIIKNDIAAKQIERLLGLIKTIEKTWGNRHVRLLPVLKNLGDLYLIAGNYEAAEGAYYQYLGITVKEFGDEHPIVAGSLEYVGQTFEVQGLHREAERFYLWALERTSGAELERLDVLCRKLIHLYEHNDQPTKAWVLEEQLNRYCA